MATVMRGRILRLHLRETTKKRMMRRLAQGNKEETWGSYLGMLSHGNAQELTKDILKMEALQKR